MPRKPPEPTVEVRTYKRSDGTISQSFSVRYIDATGKRRRKTAASFAEADFERARLVLEQLGGTGDFANPAGDSGPTLAEFWPVWLADARSRLSPRTIEKHEAQWSSRVEPAFGHLPLGQIRPRLVSQWRADLLNDGVGPNAVHKAMGLLQTMFTLAVEWGEAELNPVSVVRKPRQRARRAVRPLVPEEVERLRAELLAVGDLRSATMVSVMAYAGRVPRRRSASRSSTSARRRCSSSRRSATASSSCRRPGGSTGPSTCSGCSPATCIAI